MRRHPRNRDVFLDETGANTKLARLYGWGPKSERVVSAVPHGQWQTTTFVGALRTIGLTAPQVIDGARNGELFPAYVPQQLVPTRTPGDIVVLNNLSGHHRAGALEAAGCTLAYLPPYSPDLNPLEQLFSKRKSRLRKHGERTRESLWTRLGQLVSEFLPDECRNDLRHAGYTAN